MLRHACQRGLDAKRRRLTKKQPPPPVPLQAVLRGVALGLEADPNHCSRRVYLVTLPHPRQEFSSCGVRLVPPSKYTRSEILEIFLACCARPEYISPVAQGCHVDVRFTGVFRELHAADATGVAYPHDHLPVLAATQFRFTAVKRALLVRYGLASHWSTSHSGYWSTIRYVYVPSTTKPQAALDSAHVLWGHYEPHPPLDACCREPLTGPALDARRQGKEMKAAEAGKKARITEMDIWGIVVQNGIRNKDADDDTAVDQLIAHAKSHCSWEMREFLFRIRARLSPLIADIWAWETVEERLLQRQRSRLDALHAAAMQPCVCGGAWAMLVTTSVVANHINLPSLCRDILNSLTAGRGETTPVLCLAGALGGEGKSALLKGLLAVYAGDGEVFKMPSKGNFPLLGLERSKVIFLDEFRFNESILPYAVQCLLFDGSGVPVARPQNQAGTQGHLSYEGTSPVFCTGKLADIERIEALSVLNPATGVPWNAEASMLHRRLKVYRYTARIPKPTGKKFPYCGRCFASLVLSQAPLAS